MKNSFLQQTVNFFASFSQIKLLPLVAVTASLVLTGCASAPPETQSNLCEIFEQYPDWYEEAADMEEKWGTPISLAMSFVKQESAFVHDAKPAKKYILGIPVGRISTAYGYAQALDETWGDFKKATSRNVNRTDFGDAMQFIGWYTTASKRELNLSFTDVYNHYLAYYGGRGAFKRGRHFGKTQMLNIAQKVARQAQTYQAQLNSCEHKFKKNRRGMFGMFAKI